MAGGRLGAFLVGLYGDTPEDTLGSHRLFLSLFLFLAALSVVLAVRGFGRGLDADSNGVVVRKMLRATPIPWRELAASSSKGDFGGHWSRHVTLPSWYSSAGTDPGSPSTHHGGETRLGKHLFELRERLLAMRSAAFGYSQRGEDQEGDREDSWPVYPQSRTRGCRDRPAQASVFDRPRLVPASPSSSSSSSYLVCRPS